jgi:TonB family protein
MAARRLDRRQGFLISATVHLMILTLLATSPEKAAEPRVTPTPTPPPPEAPAPGRRALLVDPQIAQRLLRPDLPLPTPMPRGRDRISIGPPSTERAERLDLPRDEDFTSRPAGPEGPPKSGRPSPPPPAVAQAPPAPPVPAPGNAGTYGPGLSTERRGTAPGPANVPSEGSISRSLRDLDRRLGQMGPGVVEGGAGRQMGPLFFDPEGADFTGWINHFKNEVYRNWVPPQAVLFGYRGHVDFEFWVERDGRMTQLKMLKSAGTPALDRAAQNALTGSRLLPLPADFAPPRIRMQVTFYYNEASQG